MALSPTTHRFTVKDYHRMAEADIFEPDDRVELLDGEVFELAPIGVRHAAVVARLNYVFRRVGDRAIVSVQSPLSCVFVPISTLTTTRHPSRSIWSSRSRTRH